MPFFTIVTVTFNSESYLHSCLNSVLCQDFADYEHLVIDGRSTDSTLDILSGYPNPRLRYISEPDLGIYDAMNKGIANAHGTYVGFLNSDDFFQSSTILTRIHSVLSATGADICYSDINYVFPDCTTTVARHWSSKSFNRYGIAAGAFPPHPSFYCKLSMLRQINGFNLKYSLAADFDLMLRLVVDKRYVHTYLPITSVSMRLGGATNNSLTNIVSQNLQILSSLFSVLPPHVSLRYYFFRVFRRLF